MDFVKILKRYPKQGVVEIYPKFIIGKHNDIMIRGGDFYAIWVEERGLWSTDEDDVKMLIDNELDDYVKEHVKNYEESSINIQYMWDADSGTVDKWHKYCQKQQMSLLYLQMTKLRNETMQVNVYHIHWKIVLLRHMIY